MLSHTNSDTKEVTVLLPNNHRFLDRRCVLQFAEVRCSVLRVLQRVAVCCGAVCVAVGCSGLPCVAVRVLQCVCCSVLQCVAVCRSVLQCM